MTTMLEPGPSRLLVGGHAEYLLARNSRRRVLGVLIAVALFLHGAFAVALVPLTRYLERREAALMRTYATSEVEIEAPAPPPPPAPTPPPPAPAPVAEPLPEPPRERAPAPRVASPTPPPPAATPPAPPPTEAAPLMTVDTEFSNEDTVATGHNVNATGDVSADGIRRAPGQGVSGARIGGVPGGTGTGPATSAAPAAVDYSSRARLDCDEEAFRDLYPEAAREAGLAQMDVIVRIAVDASGRLAAVSAVRDPGYGFASAAIRGIREHCRATAARDREGRAVPDTVARFPVHFIME